MWKLDAKVSLGETACMISLSYASVVPVYLVIAVIRLDASLGCCSTSHLAHRPLCKCVTTESVCFFITVREGKGRV